MASPAAELDSPRSEDSPHALYEAYKDRVYSIALHFNGGDPTAARDVTQEVFLKVLRARAGFRRESSFETWLYRIVVNACIDEERKRRRFVPLSSVELLDPRAPEPSLEQREVSSLVQAAVERLRPKLRLAILLRYVEELSYEEIGRVLGCPPGTVAARLSRGHRILARELAALRERAK